MRTAVFLSLVLLAACDQQGRGQTDTSAAPATPRQESFQVGRWAIVHSPHVQRDTTLLDTATGDTWQLVRLGDGDNSEMGWQYMRRLDGPNQTNANAASSATEERRLDSSNQVNADSNLSEVNWNDLRPDDGAQ